MFGRIIHLFSIDISAKYAQNALNQGYPIIILHRHKIFLLQVIGLQVLSVVFFICYVAIALYLDNSGVTLFFLTLGVLFYIGWLMSGISIYAKHFIARKTVYIDEQVQELLDTSSLQNYIAGGILLSILLVIDILVTLLFQLVSSDTIIVQEVGFYLGEIVLCILIIFLNLRTMKVQLDFEMDQVIVSSGGIKHVDREGFYTVRSQIYVGTQIQTIEIIQSGRRDAVLKIGTLQVRTATLGKGDTAKVITFGKIAYSEVIENKIRAIL